MLPREIYPLNSGSVRLRERMVLFHYVFLHVNILWGTREGGKGDNF